MMLHQQRQVLDQLKRIDSASDVTRMREVLSQARDATEGGAERERLEEEVQRVRALE